MLRSKTSLNIYVFLSTLAHKFVPNNRIKLKIEYFFWWWTKQREQKLGNSHFEAFFTKHFEIPLSFYNSKKILDIGCGPRGSLEWAIQSETFAVDPLIHKYKKLGLENHKTTYLEAGCEALPFEDESFDVISSFNSLDHVDDLAQSIKEIKRVLKPKGTFLLIADIHDYKTICEPSAFSWDITSRFIPEFKVISESHFEGDNLYKSIRKGVKFDHANTKGSVWGFNG